MKKLLTNCHILTGERELWNHSILIESGEIQDVFEGVPEGFDGEVVDMKGKYVMPGFIDLQVNGGGTEFFTKNISVEAVEAIYRAHLDFGTTRYLPTLISTSHENIMKACEVIKECKSQGKYGVLGMHLEGPFFNLEKKGAHYPKFIRKPEQEEIAKIIEAGKDGVIEILTLAPEQCPEELLKQLITAGIKVSCGHSNANYQQAKRAFELGVNKVTHLFNAMSQFNSRNPGIVGAFFDNKDVYGGIIVDGVHADIASVRVAQRLKQGKLFLVSDASFVGNPLEEFEFDGFQLKNIDGNFYTEAGNLAGSSISMLDAVQNCVLKVGISLEETVRMSSTYPAEYLGVGDKFGKVKKGYVADLVVLERDLSLSQVFVEGEIEVEKLVEGEAGVLV